jgi:hypothetical protein
MRPRDCYSLTSLLIAAADQIRIMGFGYDETNMKRLDVANFPSNKVIGSLYGFSPAEKGRIQRLVDGKISFAESDADCMHMVRERIDWD